MKLYAITVSSRCSAAGMALDQAGIDYELIFKDFAELKTPEFKAINPNGKVPVLETPEGPIFETHAILRYVARASGKLYGSNNFENSQVDQWLDWVNANLQTLAPQFIYQIFGFEGMGLDYTKGNLFRAKKAFTDQLKVVEAALAGKTSLVGTESTIADIALLNAIMHFWTFILGDKERKQFPNIAAWLNGISTSCSAFKKWWGRTRAVPKAFNWPFFAEAAKKEAPKKKEKKKQAPAVKKEPKKPKLEFPETKFNLMSFKTEFINNKNIPEALEKFWAEYDNQGWCLYHLKYILYKDENQKIFKFNNLMKGFLRGLESVGKFIFGTHGIFGDEPNLLCQGVWLIRGTDILPPLKESGTFETYEWIKLDASKPEDKELVNKFWSLRNEDEDSIENVGTLRTFKWIK